MKDFPLFTTEHGVATVILREIPYTRCGYIHIRSSLNVEKLVEDCTEFCRMAGAESVFAAGDGLDAYPEHCRIVTMQCSREQIADTDACLFPVTEKTISQWKNYYNRAMAQIPNAAWMTDQDASQMLEQGDGYFVHADGKLLGIGKASCDTIDAIVSLEKGQGETVVKALCHALHADVVKLEVASTNERAIKLYQRMGFLQTGERICWHRVL